MSLADIKEKDTLSSWPSSIPKESHWMLNANPTQVVYSLKIVLAFCLLTYLFSNSHFLWLGVEWKAGFGFLFCFCLSYLDPFWDSPLGRNFRRDSDLSAPRLDLLLGCRVSKAGNPGTTGEMVLFWSWKPFSQLFLRSKNMRKETVPLDLWQDPDRVTRARD